MSRLNLVILHYGASFAIKHKAQPKSIDNFGSGEKIMDFSGKEKKLKKILIASFKCMEQIAIGKL